MKHLISTTFSCIGYLRDLFDENCFEDHFLCELSLKRLRRGTSPEVDALLNWIEFGIFDALEKRYLKSVHFGIYLDPVSPEDLIENYAFKISYAPFDGESCAAQLSSLSIEQNNKTIMQFSQGESDFKKMAVHILRTLCVLAQTLKARKHHTLKLAATITIISIRSLS